MRLVLRLFHIRIQMTPYPYVFAMGRVLSMVFGGAFGVPASGFFLRLYVSFLRIFCVAFIVRNKVFRRVMYEGFIGCFLLLLLL